MSIKLAALALWLIILVVSSKVLTYFESLKMNKFSQKGTEKIQNLEIAK